MSYALSSTDHEAAWNVLEASGYHRLWTPQPLKDRMRQMFLDYWAAPTEPGACLLLRYADGRAATGGVSHLAGNDWHIHLLSCLPRRGETIVRAEVFDSHREMIEECLRRGAEWISLITARDKGLSQRIYTDFTEWIGDAALTHITSASVFRRATSAPLPAGLVPSQSFIPEMFHSGGEGANLFGILNWTLMPAGSSATREADLASVNERYRLLQKSHFVLLDREEDGAPERLGFERMPNGMRWSLHRDAVPAWYVHMERLATTPR